MKFLPLSLLFVAAGVAVAAEEVLLPNKPYDGPIKCEGSETLAINGSPLSIQAGTTLLLTAKMTFTLPTEKPAYDEEVRASKLAITADTDGTLLVADGFTGAWVSSGYTVADGGSVMMRAEGNLNAESKWAFKVTFSPVAVANSAVDPAAVKTVSVVSPASATTLSGFTFTGEGETSALTLGLVDMAILPPPAADKAQDPALVEKYIAWANEAGSAVANDTSLNDTEKQNAFAMNAGGTPSLTIAAIDPTAGTITVKGSYTDPKTDPEGTSETPVDLKTINGVLTIASRESLGGTETIQTVNVTAAADGKKVVIPFPEGARFVKAAVSVNPPAATADEVNAE
ncbi:MAG: hypothetical protein MSB12_01610 [Lentisphaeraceae bacterium]|nr:hypothetical protein [Lentisphaeraceae bacterium]